MTRFICIASGPSVTANQVAYAMGKGITIAVNDSYRLCPHANFLYACDGDWWDTHIKSVRRIFSGELWTQCLPTSEKYSLSRIEGDGKPGLGLEKIHFGNSSGYQAVNLAYLWGAKEIILLGYDCQKIDGKSHWFGEHPDSLRADSKYNDWVNYYNQMAKDLKAKGVKVINCSKNSAITAFEKKTIYEALQ